MLNYEYVYVEMWETRERRLLIFNPFKSSGKRSGKSGPLSLSFAHDKKLFARIKQITMKPSVMTS